MKLHIEEYELNQIFGCRICLAADEDAYNAGEVVVLGESTFEATPILAYDRAHSEAKEALKGIDDKMQNRAWMVIK